MNFVQIAEFDCGCHGNIKGEFSKQLLKSLLLRNRKGDEVETLRTCS